MPLVRDCCVHSVLGVISTCVVVEFGAAYSEILGQEWTTSVMRYMLRVLNFDVLHLSKQFGPFSFAHTPQGTKKGGAMDLCQICRSCVPAACTQGTKKGDAMDLALGAVLSARSIIGCNDLDSG